MKAVPQKRTPATPKTEACPPEQLSLALSKAIARLFSAPDLDGLQRRLPETLVHALSADHAHLVAECQGGQKVLASTVEGAVGRLLEAGDTGALSLPLRVEGHPPMAVSIFRKAPFSPEEQEMAACVLSSMPDVWKRLEHEKHLQQQVESHQAELRQGEFKLDQLREQLAQSERMKAEFVATMSHELRTPLNVVLGFGSLLADEAFGELNAQQGEACQKILESSERLAILINDLLDFSRLQAHTLDFRFAAIELGELLRETIDDIAPLAERKNLETHLDVAADVPKLRADPDRLRQALKHLLDNALKFTPEGGRIGVKAWLEGEFVRIDVWDTGIGIPNEAMHRMFERFYQVDSSNTRLYGGTGIGLALVKELVERHGGQVSVESQVGKGSTFHLWLPVDGPPEETMSPHGARRWSVH